MTARYQVWLGVLAFSSLTSVSAPQSPGRAILQSVETTVQGDLTIVTIAADGPLPQPTAASLDAPPRFFLDFTGVTPKARGTTAMPGGGRVKQVRVALHSTAPDVTRVVLDLTQREVFRVEGDARQSGRIRILIGSISAMTAAASPGPAPAPAKPIGVPPPPAAPVAAAPPSPPPTLPSPPPTPASPPPIPAAPAGSGLATGVGSTAAIPSPTPTPPSPARRGPPAPETIPSARLPVSEIENYRRQLAGVILRLEARRSVIAAIDLDQSVAVETLSSTAEDFRVLRRILEQTKPSEVLRPTHNLLIASSELGARAASLRGDADRMKDLQVRRNAASAAAGALMLLDRACAVLGCTGGR